MLAKRGVPFDSPEHLFEIKWDGTRALAFVESRGYRLVNRHRYPELGFLAQLPAGTVLDGEVVVLRQGKPDFGLLLSRNHARAPLKIRSLALRRWRPGRLTFTSSVGPASAESGFLPRQIPPHPVQLSL
jgi:hypothetical protein